MEHVELSIRDIPEVDRAARVRVPVHADHRFRSKPITDSGRSRSRIPEHADR